jgi:hypothetical protein
VTEEGTEEAGQYPKGPGEPWRDSEVSPGHLVEFGPKGLSLEAGVNWGPKFLFTPPAHTMKTNHFLTVLPNRRPPQ